MAGNQTTEHLDSKPRISVRVLFFGAAREVTECREANIEVPAPATVASAFENIKSRFPALKEFGNSLLVALNLEYREMNSSVSDGDELAIFPPVSGGASDDKDRDEDHIKDFILTTEPLDLELLRRHEQIPECGAMVILDGFARGITKGKQTRYLIYEAYDSMALRAMRDIGSAAMNRYGVSRIKIMHRLGRIEIGETSVLVAVSAPHRKEAFEACQWAIKEVKRTVPIWKKEFYEDGSAWVQDQEALS